MSELSPALYRAGSGEPVVLIHGFTGAWHHWRPVLADLVARYEVIAPTLAGHDGGPPFPAGLEMTLESAADSFEAHLDELGVGTAHFVGNSLGGAIALELAKRGRARTVVALAPAGGWNDGDPELQRLATLFRRTVRLARLSEGLTRLVVRRPSTRRLAFRDAMRHGELLSPAEALALSRATARCVVADAAIAALAAGRMAPLRELDRIACPVLVASPQHDRILPAELHAPRFRREIPGVEARTLAGCGHVPMWDDTPLVVSTIREFVERHTHAGAGAGPNGYSPQTAGGTVPTTA
ncbi:MAG TPA: alpha/beta fold hydrolase [Solirubrobacteraceae bacterium]|nr:alpha/beta fold hydrolase [Solirubrobacteraceae bacterium]